MQKLSSFLIFITFVLTTGVQGFIAKNQFEKVAVNSYDQNFQNHPCRRECQQGESLICSYQLEVHYRQVVGPECQDCLDDPTACQDEECIYADGVPNMMMTVNNMWPAPPIEVCENDTIVAEVFNWLDEGTTMHWHGMHMSQSKDMDGAPFITQDPIAPGDMMRYTFLVDRSGTIWYHSHMFWQRALGVAGSLVIRQPKENDPYSDLYDYDDIEHTLMITDMVYNSDFNEPRNILVDGQGRNHLNSWPDNDSRHNYKCLTVSHGKRYRMRIISNGVSNCPIEISIENHDMLVIAADGNNMEPTLADSFFLTSAERLDFILEANQQPGSYWIKFKGHNDCAKNNLYQGAVLQYEESLPAGREVYPPTSMDYMGRKSLTKVNILAEVMTKVPSRALQIDEVTTVGLRSLNSLPWPSNTKFTTYYTSFGLLRVDGHLYMQADDITFANPHKSLLQAKQEEVEEEFCNRETFTKAGTDCTTTNCECTNVIKMPAFTAVEMIVVNFMNSSHPFHIHGFTFRLVGQGERGNAADLRNIRDLDQRGLLMRQPDDYPAVEKDTAQIPPLGYIIIRFISDNTGFWLFHCHIERHSLKGMAGVVHVIDNE